MMSVSVEAIHMLDGWSLSWTPLWCILLKSIMAWGIENIYNTVPADMCGGAKRGNFFFFGSHVMLEMK